MDSCHDLQRFSGERLLAMGTIRVSDTWTEMESIVQGGFEEGRDYTRIRFKRGGTAWMDVDSGRLVRGISPSGKKKR